ncbi:hypothetical protein RUESEDTHA_04119 [Ruegeria sp. THAF57]|nr:hypothetical protein RUESEDTHA_04119 [Ruegeria sp. THAF57]
MRVLRAFQFGDHGLSNQELSERTGIPKSTISRLTFTLLELGFLAHASRNDKFRPGPGLLALGQVANDAMPFVQQNRECFQKIADDTNSLVLMLAREDNALMIISAVRPTGRVGRTFDVGHRLPLVGSSSGHAFMATMEDAEFETLLPDLVEEYKTPEDQIRSLRAKAAEDIFNHGFHFAPTEGYFNTIIKAVATTLYSRDLAQQVAISCVVGRNARSDAELSEFVGPKMLRELDGEHQSLNFLDLSASHQSV